MTRQEQSKWKALCRDILDRDGWLCRNHRCSSRNNLNVHHVTFRSHQGPDETWNLATLCQECHDAIHNYRLKMEGDADIFWPAKGGLTFTILAK